MMDFNFEFDQFFNETETSLIQQIQFETLESAQIEQFDSLSTNETQTSFNYELLLDSLKDDLKYSTNVQSQDFISYNSVIVLEQTPIQETNQAEFDFLPAEIYNFTPNPSLNEEISIDDILSNSAYTDNEVPIQLQVEFERLEQAIEGESKRLDVCQPNNPSSVNGQVNIGTKISNTRGARNARAYRDREREKQYKLDSTLEKTIKSNEKLKKKISLNKQILERMYEYVKGLSKEA